MQIQPATESSSSVLIVEDDRDIAVLIRRMLADAGFNSDIAYNVKQARELLNDKGDMYKVVTLDILMPEEGGMSFFDELRKNPATHDLPVVVISAVANDTKRALNGGAIGVMDWLQKPIDQDRLIMVIEQALDANQQARILHVEDDEDVHQVVSAMLKGKCELVWTTSVAESREKLEAEHFDLVLLDIGLPDGSGLNLLETIERNVSPPRVVIFSAHDVSAEIAGKVSAVLVKSKTKNEDLLGVITGAMKAD